MGKLLAWIVHGYRESVGRLMPKVCRFEPSCSKYMMIALRRHGALKGLALGTWRILRCHPWGGCGPDPVPGAEEPEPPE